MNKKKSSGGLLADMATKNLDEAVARIEAVHETLAHVKNSDHAVRARSLLTDAIAAVNDARVSADVAFNRDLDA